MKRIEEEKKSEEDSQSESESSSSSEEEEEPEEEESEGMKKVGKKGIKSRRMVKSTNKKAPKVEDVKVSVKDAKAASKKGVKKAVKE